MKIFKKTILIDLDGVLNQYDGIYDENTIPAPRQDSKEFLNSLKGDIYSSDNGIRIVAHQRFFVNEAELILINPHPRFKKSRI